MIVVIWKEPTDTGTSAITGYQIEESTDGGTSWTDLVANTNNTNEYYFHTGLTPDTTLHYRVSAINKSGTGPPSETVFATTMGVTEPGGPGPPTGLSAKPGGQTTIDLEWEPPADTGTSAIEAYRIEVSSDSSLWTDLEEKYSGTTDMVETDYSHTGLAPNTKRYYRVSAINADATGPPSNVASATTESAAVGGAPGKPTNARAHAVDDTMIVVTWKEPTDTGTSAITGYQIEVSADGGTSWTNLVANTNNTEFYFHTGLTPGTTLHYRVSAINQAGTGPPSGTVFATTMGVTEPGAPGPPTGLSAKPGGQTTIDLEWKPPADTGTSAIEAYRIEVSSDGALWTDLEEKYSGTTDMVETNYSHTGLAPSTKRYYRVSAINADATGPPSNVASATTDSSSSAGSPGPPRNLKATPFATEIQLDWDAPATTGLSVITGYRIEVSSNGGEAWTGLVANTGSTATRYRHRGLLPGTTRHYRVSAINSVGTGKPSNVTSATTKETTVPGAPTGLTATARGQSRIDLAWAAPASDGGSPVTGYQIEVSVNAGTAWAVLVSNTNSVSTTYSHAGLSASTTRHYRVSAINAEGTGRVSNVASTRTGAGVPGAPSGLVAARKGQSQIDPIWTAPSDDGGSEVTGYRIEFSENGGQSWLVLVNNTASVATTYSDTGLSPGTSRHYRVSAINAEGTGPASNIAHASTGVTIPGAPTNLTAAAQGQTQIALFWAAPSDTGGAAVTGYRIEVSENAGLGWVVLVQNTGSTSTTHSHTGLAAGTTRHYRVSAINAAGIGPASNVVQATTGASAPDAPTNLTARPNGTSQIDLSWTAPANDGGSPIIGYRIQASSDQEPGWSTLVDNTGSPASLYSHTNLSPASTWRYRVQAINAVDKGPESEEARATTCGRASGSADGADRRRARTLLDRADLGGADLYGRGSHSGLQDRGARGRELPLDRSRGQHTLQRHGLPSYLGLDPGSTRYYRVSAINAAGIGPASNVAQATTGASAPDAPTNLTARPNGTSQIDLSWTAPANDGGSPIIGYRIQASSDQEPGWSTLVDNTGSPASLYSHTNLSPASTWRYRVQAINAVDKGPESEEARATTAAALPEAPTELTAAARGPSWIELTWEAPTYTGGVPIRGYKIEVHEEESSLWIVLVANTRSTGTGYHHLGLDPGSTRYYRVSAINSAGVGPESGVARARTDPVVPGKPTGLTATVNGTSQIDLAWSPPDEDGGGPISGYRIEVFTEGATEWAALVEDTRTSTTEYSHTGLKPASTWTYRVSAINSAGYGNPSTMARATTEPDVPAPPVDLTATANGTSRIDLAWEAPAYDGGAPIAGYHVEVSENSGASWSVLVADTRSTTNVFSHESLSPASTRHYRVSAINRAGTGAPSRTAFATTDATVPDPPTRLDASARDHSQIDLSWQTPAFDGGSRITGHRIEVSENAGLDWRDLVANTGSTNTTYMHAGLPPATTRHYRVSAINQLGTGRPSKVVSATTDATVPDPPRDLVALATSPTRIDLVWRAPAYDGGAPVTSYRVEVSADGDRWTDLVPSTGQATTSYAHTGLSPGTMRFYRVSAINVAGTGLPSGVAAASTDDPLQRAGRVNEAVLPRFGAAMTTSTLSAIAGRIEAVAMGTPLASQLSAAGLPSLTGTPVSSDPGRGPSISRLLDGASFVLPLGGGSEGQQAGSNFSVGTWGSAHHHRMGEPGAEEVQWEGQMLTVHLGTDVRVHRDLLAGVAGSRSSGNYDFTDVTGNRKVSGTYEPRMTSVSPYLAWLPGRTGVTIWTAGSFGWGQVAIDDEIEGIRRSDMRMMAGALGGSRILMSSATSSLRLRAEGWLSRIELPGAEGVDSLTLQIRRARAALEWSQEYDFDSGSRVGIVMEGGMRYGQGDGPEGTRARMEIGGGLRYVSPSGRVTLEGHGRSLVADGSGYEERGFRGLVQVALQDGKRGLSFKLMPVWGNATSRVQELWERGVSDRSGSSHVNLGGRLNTEIEYGLPSFDGTLLWTLQHRRRRDALIGHRDEVSSRPSPRPPRRGDAQPKRRGTRPPRLGTEGPLAAPAPMTETKGVRTKCETNAPTPVSQPPLMRRQKKIGLAAKGGLRF